MKKLLSLLLALAMCVSLAACGGGDESAHSASGDPASAVSTPESPAPAPDPAEPAGSDSVSGEGTVYTDYDLLSQVDVYNAFSPAELAGTTWNFSGGFTNGKDLTEEEAASVLEMYSGTLQVAFQDEEHATLVQGGGNMEGSYKLLDDGITLNFSFELQGQAYTYGAVFTSLSGEDGADSAEAVLILVADADPTTAFYMTPVLEG